MKVLELMKFFEKAMKTMSDAGIRMEDCRYIEVWEQYRELMARGNKKTYVIAFLAAKNNISERTLIRIINRFEQEI